MSCLLRVNCPWEMRPDAFTFCRSYFLKCDIIKSTPPPNPPRRECTVNYIMARCPSFNPIMPTSPEGKQSPSQLSSRKRQMLSDRARLRRDNTHQLLRSVRFVQQIAMHDLISLRIDDMTAQAIGGARLPASACRGPLPKALFFFGEFCLFNGKKTKQKPAQTGRPARNAFPPF